MASHKTILIAVLALGVIIGPANGAEGLLIKLYYDGAPARLADTSFVPYAVYDEYAVGEVSVGYAGRLAGRGFRFDVIADDIQEEHVARQVGDVSVQKHTREDRVPRRRAPFGGDEGVVAEDPVRSLVREPVAEEDEDVQGQERVVDVRRAARNAVVAVGQYHVSISVLRGKERIVEKKLSSRS